MKVVRRSTTKLLILLIFSGLLFLAGTLLAADVDYPTRPVTVNLGFAPGGATYISAQIVLESLPRYSTKPQPFILSNRVGASGMVATDYFMKQPADGYNLFWHSPDTTTSMAKDPQKWHFTVNDFAFIGYFAYSPFVVAVPNESPFKTFEEFIDYAKKHPSEMTCSSPGLYGGVHLCLEMLMKEAGVKITHVPFPSGITAMTAMLGGHVTCYIGAFGLVSPHIKGGRARALVVFDTKRYPQFPEVPTIKEKGYNVVRGSGACLIAKKGTPKPILDYLVNLFKQMGNDPTVQSNLINAGLAPMYMGPEETEKFVNHDFEVVSDMFRRLGLLGK